ncbi:hypothetical protein ROHU_030299 [Labeo rohita]|uniref:Uncharacterized protein n=1 Tax=Labeo rohita TaxID=84645 RepID=A0A498LVE5_LABRO|nr:hypothetical protein ROHU_030299 [Labeo rohita]
MHWCCYPSRYLNGLRLPFQPLCKFWQRAKEEEVVVDKGDEDALFVALGQAELELALFAGTVAAVKLEQIVQQLVDIGAAHKKLWGAMIPTVEVQETVFEILDAVALEEKLHELCWMAACSIVGHAAQGAHDRVFPHSVEKMLQSLRVLIQCYRGQCEEGSDSVHEQEIEMERMPV